MMERSRNSQRLAVLGVVVLLVTFGLGFFRPDQFYRAYLVAFVFWLGIALGCLAILMLHHLSGGAWGAVILRPLEAGTRTIPLLVVVGLPLLLGLPFLFTWTRPQEVSQDALLQYKSPYLNEPFFLLRTALYYVIWIGLAYVMNRWSRERDESGDARITHKLRVFSAVGLVVFGLAVSFAAIDWIMSLEPDWYSTIYPAMVALGGLVSAFAFAIVVTALLARRPPLSEFVSANLYNDLGSLLLAFIMIWAYLAYSQFLLIWSGNLPDEIPWYLRRLNGGWEWVALFVAVMYFVLPLMLLIWRDLKRHAWSLALVAGLLVVTRWVDVFWLIIPAFERNGFAINLLDVLAPSGIGALWIAAYRRELASRPLVPLHYPKLAEAIELAHGQG